MVRASDYQVARLRGRRARCIAWKPIAFDGRIQQVSRPPAGALPAKSAGSDDFHTAAACSTGGPRRTCGAVKTRAKWPRFAASPRRDFSSFVNDSPVVRQPCSFTFSEVFDAGCAIGTACAKWRSHAKSARMTRNTFPQASTPAEPCIPPSFDRSLTRRGRLPGRNPGAVNAVVTSSVAMRSAWPKVPSHRGSCRPGQRGYLVSGLASATG